jgi:hypothetical protein
MSGTDDRDHDHELSAKIDALPREIEPGRDLWQGVASRIDAQRSVTTSRRRTYGVAALAFAATFAAAAAYVMAVRAPRGQGDVEYAPVAQVGSVAPAPSSSAPSAPPKVLVPEEEHYRAALAALVPTFEARRRQLPDDGAKRIDASLRAIEAAKTTTRAALAAHPDDPDLRAELDAEYEQEIQTMNDVLDWTTRS